jgi:hypothetical protein
MRLLFKIPSLFTTSPVIATDFNPEAQSSIYSKTDPCSVPVLFCSWCARSNQTKNPTSRKLSEKVRENYIAKIKDKLGEDANPYYVGLQAKQK